MEERFKEIGREKAKEFEEKFGVQADEEMVERAINFSFAYFCADCCDDYSKTIREQHDLGVGMMKYLISRGADETAVRRYFRI